ncbi:hypothetical protein DsansV1_C01g0004891 [Dioscorea sansibarensis]
MYLEIELGHRREITEEVRGLLDAAPHLLLNQTVHLRFHPRVAVILIDVRQRIDVLVTSYCRPTFEGGIRRCLQHQNLPSRHFSPDILRRRLELLAKTQE